MARHIHNIAIVGSGLSGLATALKCADAGYDVAILTKENLIENSSYYAQGGIAAVWDLKDSFDAHIQDTLSAGAGLCDKAAVEYVVRQGPQSIQWLVDNGVVFSHRDERSGHPEEFHLTKEGGHSARRVIHSADATGRTVATKLELKIRCHPNITIYEKLIGIELIRAHRLGHSIAQNRCIGLYALNIDTENVVTILSDAVVLATGGASKAYLFTSNPDTSTGDGIAMAWRSGCRVANMEFVQFHPTCLYHPHAKSFLISEAVRGEGGRLILPDGSTFMHKYDLRQELASRDIVARAIDHEMKVGGYDCVYLDISMKSPKWLKHHFPTIVERCLELGIDITKEPVPVVPAAHYTCGGVIVDLNGCTDLPGLYCVGESANSGLHGANRLASNSLLECIVFADAAFRHICDDQMQREYAHCDVPDWDESQVTDPDELIVISHNWDELRRFMWDYVGIVRTQRRLQRALRRVEMLSEEVREFYSLFRVNRDLIELRNLIQVAELIVRCALQRCESRGLHFVLDYPETSTEHEKNTVLEPETTA